VGRLAGLFKEGDTSMTELDYFLTADDRVSSSQKTAASDYLARLVVPSLGIIATIVVSLRGMPTSIEWGLIGVTVLSLILGFLPVMRSVFERVVDRMRDRRAVHVHHPQLRALAHRFEDFVNGSRQDTLHYTCDSFLCEGHGQKIEKLGMPNMAAWSGRSELFSRRLDHQKPSFTSLRGDVLEFYDIVGTYNNLCVAAVFDRLPAELMAGMTPRAKRNLGAFQQRFVRFLSDAEQVLKNIGAARPALKRLPQCFAPTRPLL
jgi:hypothetical protein